MLSYVGALHHPKPHDVGVGVLGTSPLPVAVGKQFSLKITRYPNEAAVRSRSARGDRQQASTGERHDG